MQVVSLRAQIMKFEDQPDGSLIVTGRMMTQDLDKQNEITDYEGAKIAAQKWEGNIREMHQLKAVGRAIDVMPNDAEKAIYIRGRISAGASDTITKIKDGTLRDFSIGGSVNPNGRVAVRVSPDFARSHNVPAEKIGKAITMLKDWDMAELSVVDSGANPHARIEIVKTIGGVPTMTNVVAKGEMEEFIAEETVTPNPAPEEPENPMDDEKAIVAHLVEARRHLEAAAKLEVDEVQEHGSFCLDLMTGCINSIRDLEKTKVMTGAAEIAGASMLPAPIVAMANRIRGVRKGMVSYKLDKKELKALTQMIDNLEELTGSIKAFMDEHGAELAGEKPPEGEAPKPEEEMPKPGADEQVAAGEEKPAEELPADGAPAAKMYSQEGDAEKCGEGMGMKKTGTMGGGERAEQLEAKPHTAEKSVRGGSVQKLSTVGDEDKVMKAVEGAVSGLKGTLEDIAKRLSKIESEPAGKSPVRFASAVEKEILGQKTIPVVSEVDAAISKVFGELGANKRDITEQDIRLALAKDLAKSAPRI